jgi:hypothetical protein
MTDIRRAIEAEFGDFPLAALTDRRTRGAFKAWRLGPDYFRASFLSGHSYNSAPS